MTTTSTTTAPKSTFRIVTEHHDDQQYTEHPVAWGQTLDQVAESLARRADWLFDRGFEPAWQLQDWSPELGWTDTLPEDLRGRWLRKEMARETWSTLASAV